MYPGDADCRMQSPHSIWHEESANGLLECVFWVDKMNEILKKATYEEIKDIDDI